MFRKLDYIYIILLTPLEMRFPAMFFSLYLI